MKKNILVMHKFLSKILEIKKKMFLAIEKNITSTHMDKPDSCFVPHLFGNYLFCEVHFFTVLFRNTTTIFRCEIFGK